MLKGSIRGSTLTGFQKKALIASGITAGGGLLAWGQVMNDEDGDRQQFLKQVKPSFEAAVRAGRLFYTGSQIVMDYRNFQNMVSSTTMNAKEFELEQEVLKWKNKLIEAQEAYEHAATTKRPEEEILNGKKAVKWTASKLADVEEELSNVGNSTRKKVHEKAAHRLLELCKTNGGVYVKVGQHIANLDYLVPEEYIDILSALFDDASPSSYQDVREVIKEDLGKYPEDLFTSFSEKPIACASLAQVYVAFDKETGEKLAIKVQHRGLRESSVGDIIALKLAVKVIEYLFPEFTLGWLAEEIAPQLPRELDFSNEGKNSEEAAEQFADDDSIIIPNILWNFTSPRVLSMNFEEGFQATDKEAILLANLKPSEVSKLILSVFNRQVFESGFVHCDPHAANVLIREHPYRKGRPQLILLDHGLYKKIDDSFRIAYAKLWTSMMIADIEGIKIACEELGVKDMYPLLAAILTARPFDEIIERSKSGSFNTSSSDPLGDKAMIKGYAQRYLKEIIQMLDTVPRQMLLLFKMNDCMRHISYTLGSPSSTNIVVAGSHAAQAVFRESSEHSNVKTRIFGSGLSNLYSYMKIHTRLFIYELLSSFR